MGRFVQFRAMLPGQYDEFQSFSGAMHQVERPFVPILLTALKNRATFALKNGPPSSQHFFATNALHPAAPAAEGICGEKMFPGTLGAGPRESAKVASFESAVDTIFRYNR